MAWEKRDQKLQIFLLTFLHTWLRMKATESTCNVIDPDDNSDSFAVDLHDDYVSPYSPKGSQVAIEIHENILARWPESLATAYYPATVMTVLSLDPMTFAVR